MDARETALKILYEVEEKKAYSNIAINREPAFRSLSGQDTALASELIHGVIKMRLYLDYVIEQFSSVKLRKISPWILEILRLGAYQILFLDRVPVSAACNESVKLAKKYGHQASSRFVNGLLRNLARSSDSIIFPNKNEDPVKYLSVKYSHQEWMVKNWLERFGVEFTEELLKKNNEVPDFTVRVNRLKITPSQMAERLKDSGFEAVPGKFNAEALIIKNPSSIMRTPFFEEGLINVQDESSMLAARVLEPQPGELVADVCSAPGGKSTHIAEMMNNQGTVLARDIHQHKIKLIEEAKLRLGTTIVKPQLYDALQRDEELVLKADRVLVDVPCTGLGIIRRKPDIKWTRSEGDIKEITALQKKILENSSQYVKPGGILVYSTCTIEKEENGDIIKEFLRMHPEFVPEDFTGLLPEMLKDKGAEMGHIQIFPNMEGADGFFISRLRRLTT